EAEAEARHRLVLFDIVLIVRVAILGLHIAVRADRMLEPGAEADAVEIAAIAEIGRTVATVVIIVAEAGIGVAGLGVEEGVRSYDAADAASDIEIALGADAEAVAHHGNVAAARIRAGIGGLGLDAGDHSAHLHIITD